MRSCDTRAERWPPPASPSQEERVKKLEARSRKLVEKGICKGDYDMAAQLAADIEAEEREIQAREKRDRQLARKLVREVSKGLMQADKETQHMSKQINGAPAARRAPQLRSMHPFAHSALVWLWGDAPAYTGVPARERACRDPIYAPPA